MRKILNILVVIIIVLVSGCSSQQSSTKKNGTVELEFWTINLKEGYSDYIEGNIKKYETEHPGTKIKWIDVPDFDKTDAKLLASISGGNVPDVVNLTPFMIPKFAKIGALTNIEDIKPGLSEKYVEAFWNAGEIDGKPYGIPFYGSVPAVIINSELFRKSGLDPDKPPKTWAEVKEYSEIIKQKTGIAGNTQTLDNFADSGNPIDILARRGIKILSNDGKEAAFNTPEAVKIVQEYVDMSKSGSMNAVSLTGTMMDAATQFSQEKSGMIFLGPWIMRWLEQNTDAETFKKFKAYPGIVGDDGKLNAFEQIFVVPAKSKYPKEAVEFATFFSGTTIELMKKAPVAPTQKEQYNDPYFESGQIEVNLIKEGVNNATFYWPLVPGLTEMIESLRNAFQEASLGKKSPEEALNDAAKKWNEILSR